MKRKGKTILAEANGKKHCGMEERPGKSGRIEEFRKGTDLKGEVMASLKT